MLNKLIKLSEKRTDLLIELKNSLQFEKCSYQIDKQPGTQGRYFLILISEKKIVADGTPEKIKSYLRIRNINSEVIYNFNLIA